MPLNWTPQNMKGCAPENGVTFGSLACSNWAVLAVRSVQRELPPKMWRNEWDSQTKAEREWLSRGACWFAVPHPQDKKIRGELCYLRLPDRRLWWCNVMSRSSSPQFGPGEVMMMTIFVTAS